MEGHHKEILTKGLRCTTCYRTHIATTKTPRIPNHPCHPRQICDCHESLKCPHQRWGHAPSPQQKRGRTKRPRPWLAAVFYLSPLKLVNFVKVNIVERGELASYANGAFRPDWSRNHTQEDARRHRFRWAGLRSNEAAIIKGDPSPRTFEYDAAQRNR